MAVFKNRDKKRRLWENPQQRRAREKQGRWLLFQEEGITLKAKVQDAIKQISRTGNYRTEEPLISVVRNSLTSLPSKKRQEISVMHPMKEETWAEYFGLKFYRVQKWLRALWATANFRRPSIWMTTRYLREGGRHEISTH